MKLINATLNLTLYTILLILALALFSSTFSLISAASCGGITSCACGDTVTSSYTFSADLSCSGNALTLNSSNLLLSCANYTLRGNTSGTGILTNNADNLTIKQCNLLNFSTGIYFNFTNNSLVTNNTLRNNTAFGLFLSAFNNTIILNSIKNNLLDINLTSSSSQNILHQNYLFSNTSVADYNNTNKWNSSSGNFWEAFDRPIEGCTDTNSNSYCDAYYNLSGSSNNADLRAIFTSQATGVNITSNSSFQITTLNSNVSYLLTITNQGNTAASFNLAITNIDNLSVASLNQTTAESISPNGGTKAVILTLGNAGKTGSYTVSINATQSDNSLIIASINITAHFNDIACNTRINSNLNLTANMLCSTDAIIVNASNLSITCNDFIINGSNANTGITLSNFVNTTISRCTIFYFRTGISIFNSNNTLINKSNFYNNTYIAINATQTYNLILSYNTLTKNNFTAIHFSNIIDSIIINTTVANSVYYGIRISNSINNTIRYNQVTDNTLLDIWSDANSTNNTIYQNTFSSTAKANDTGLNYWNGNAGAGAGNTWLNYNEISENCLDTSTVDGFCDTAVTIQGTASSNKDYYPYQYFSCGDAVVNYGEECDGTELNNQTCRSQGFYEGELRCGSTCKFYFTDCGRTSEGFAGNVQVKKPNPIPEDAPPLPSFGSNDLYTLPGAESATSQVQSSPKSSTQSTAEQDTAQAQDSLADSKSAKALSEDSSFFKNLASKFNKFLEPKDEAKRIIILKLKETESADVKIGENLYNVTALAVRSNQTILGITSLGFVNSAVVELKLKNAVSLDLTKDKKTDVSITLLSVQDTGNSSYQQNSTATIKFTDLTPENKLADFLSRLYKRREPADVNKAVICKRSNDIPITDSNYLIPSDLSIPVDLERDEALVVEPFNINCTSSYDSTLTFNVPTDIADIKARKCLYDRCETIDIKRVDSVKCGNDLIASDQALQLAKKPQENLTLLSSKFALTSSDNKTFSFKLEYALGNTTRNISLPENPNLRLVSPPIILTLNLDKLNIAKTKASSNDSEIKNTTSNATITISEQSSPQVSIQLSNLTLTVPYITDPEVDENSVKIYFYQNNTWQVIGGKIDKQKRTISANIESLSEYVSNNSFTFSLIGIYCKNCHTSSFENIYQPIGGSVTAVILVHGLGSTPATYNEMINDIRFTSQPWQLWTFAYPSNKYILENSINFANEIEANNEQFTDIHLVGHSLGGSTVQEMLDYAYKENQKDPAKYTFIKKVKSATLIGSTNEGIAGSRLFQLLFKYLANLRAGASVFDPDSAIIQELSRDKLIDRVPGVKYFVVAGTKPYKINTPFVSIDSDDLFNFNESNDGIITVSNAQHIGDAYVNKLCENYWEIYDVHTGLLDTERSRKIIEKIIADQVAEAQATREEAPVDIASNKYYELEVKNCRSDDLYLLTGYIVPEEKAEDLTLCSCGNGYCNIGEDEISCPSDCKRVFTKENICYPNLMFALTIIFSLLVIVTFVKRIRHIFIGIVFKFKNLFKSLQSHHDKVNQVKPEKPEEPKEAHVHHLKISKASSPHKIHHILNPKSKTILSRFISETDYNKLIIFISEFRLSFKFDFLLYIKEKIREFYLRFANALQVIKDKPHQLVNTAAKSISQIKELLALSYHTSLGKYIAKYKTKYLNQYYPKLHHNFQHHFRRIIILIDDKIYYYLKDHKRLLSYYERFCEKLTTDLLKSIYEGIIWALLILIGIQAVYCNFIILDVLILLYVILKHVKFTLHDKHKEHLKKALARSKTQEELKKSAISKLSSINSSLTDLTKTRSKKKYAINSEKLRNRLSLAIQDFFKSYYHIKYQFTLPELIHDLKKKKESTEMIAKLEQINQAFENFRYGTEQDNLAAAKEIIRQIKEMIREI